MYNYILGTVTDIEGTYIVLEASGIGYQINTPNPYSFDIGNTYKVFVYQHIREDELTLYGFKLPEEKALFLKLINVKGLGPKIALPILATGSISGIMDAIERENILYLKKFPKIGEKLAKQIVLDLKGKINITGVTSTEDNNSEEIIEVLKGLGYKEKGIKGIINKIDSSLTIEEQIKEALRLLLN